MKKLLAILGISFFSISSTFACSCMLPKHPLEAADESVAVFIGDVSNIEPYSRSTEFGELESNKVTFNIVYNIKGADGTSIEITTPRDSATCGFNFEAGKQYVVYAYENQDEGGLSVSLCSRTALTGDAMEDIQAFNIATSEDGKIINNSNPGGNDIINGNQDNNIQNQVTDDSTKNIVDNSSKKNIYIGIAVAILAVLLIVIGAKTIKN